MQRVIEVIEGNHSVLCRVVIDKDAQYAKDKSGVMELRFKFYKLTKRQTNAPREAIVMGKVGNSQCCSAALAQINRELTK